MKETVVVGSRGSKLALQQTRLVMARLRKQAPGTTFQLQVIRTQGDKILDVALSKIGDKGLFVKEIETALLEGTIDLAVHSMKDVPTAIPEGLELGALLKRSDPRDVLVSPHACTLAELPAGARLGTGSLRRIAQLAAAYPHLRFEPVRGNLDTRLQKMERGEYAALILAYAGLERLGWLERVAEVLPLETCLPAVGQCALGVEIRSGDERLKKRVASLDDLPTRLAVTAERSFLRHLEGGCQVPLGALGTLRGANTLRLEGMIASLDGGTLLRDTEEGPAREAREIGVRLAQKLLARGAGAILEEVRRHCDAWE